MSENNAVRLNCQVRVVGAGLLGASIGLRLASQGVEVILAGSSPTTLKLAVDLGAGRLAAWRACDAEDAHRLVRC